MTKILNVTDTSQTDWDAAWQNSKSATFYHSRLWAEIWESYTQGRIKPAAKTILFSDNVKVVLPVMCKNYYKGLIKRFALTGPPFLSKYGNWLTNDHLSQSHVELLSNFILKKYNNLTWQLNPFDDDSKYVVLDDKHVLRYPEIDYVIDLSTGMDKIFSNFKNSCKNHINQAVNNKLMVTEEYGTSSWKKYYEIYCHTLKRWGKKVPYILQWNLFNIVSTLPHQYVKLWLVRYDNRIIAGCINFYSNQKIMGWHMASLTEYRHLRPNHFMEYQMIKDGVQNRYLWYDMGTDAGSKGLQDFKRSFGPEKMMSDKIVKWNLVIHQLLNFKRKFQKE